MVGVPLQRATNFGERNLLTDEEFKAREAAFARQNDEDNAEFSIEKVTPEQEARGAVGGPVSPPPHWLERGRPSYQASLIVNPPDGRMPPQTPEGTQRLIAQRDAAAARGPADSYEYRSLYDQCITRGVLGSLLPVIYNNGNQIIQAPGVVVLRNEMIHETRSSPSTAGRTSARGSAATWATRGRAGTATRWSSRRPTCSTETASAATAAASRSATR